MLAHDRVCDIAEAAADEREGQNRAVRIPQRSGEVLEDLDEELVRQREERCRLLLQHLVRACAVCGGSISPGGSTLVERRFERLSSELLAQVAVSERVAGAEGADHSPDWIASQDKAVSSCVYPAERVCRDEDDDEIDEKEEAERVPRAALRG